MKNRYEELVILNPRNAMKLDKGLNLLQKTVLIHFTQTTHTGGVKNSLKTDVELALKTWAEIFTIALPKVEITQTEPSSIDLTTLRINPLQPRNCSVTSPKIYDYCRANASVFLGFLNICYSFSLLLPNQSGVDNFEQFIDLIEKYFVRKELDYLGARVEKALKKTKF